MFTQVKTPQDVFLSPQRLLVPLFQRPYVWNMELQWQPLWEDVRRVAERVEKNGSSSPHFLGAVVLQQQPTVTGSLGIRTVIDGQQRLTTLQLLLDAVHSQVSLRGHRGSAQQALDLVENQEHWRSTNEDAFKVWPTNKDRAAFNEVMSAPVPVDYGALVHRESRLARAHKYFSNEIDLWLSEGDDQVRSAALVNTVSNLLQLVVIDLQSDEDAQEIFETLNARGTPLTAADLIKNFVFQRLNASPKEAELAYRDYWETFETPFWEEEVTAGRIRYSRSSLFLTQWLISQTREDITAREVFIRFKHYVTEGNDPVQALLPKLKRAADKYRAFTEGSTKKLGALSRIEVFVYRISTLDSEVVKPVLLWLLDPEQPEINADQLAKGLDALESWFVRRAIVRASTKAYNRLMVELLNQLASGNRFNAGDIIQDYLSKQSSENSYWPTDDDIRRDLLAQPIYKRLSRARLRMILEALEDRRRGFNHTQGGSLSESAVPRNLMSIEHVIPQEWRTAWQGDEHDETGMARDVLVHVLGNLTLVTQSLNSKISNSAWAVKKAAFMEHATLLLTADIVNSQSTIWDAKKVHDRTELMAEAVLSIWPVPSNNLGLQELGSNLESTRVTVADLVHSGFLRAGQPIYARVQAHYGRVAYISEDGGIYVDGIRDETPSGAAKKVTKSQSEAGWWFWLTDLNSGECLSDLRKAYLDSLSLESDEDE